MEHLLFSLSAVIILGISAQWLGWRLRLPSILLLLVFGILAGPVLGFIRPDEMLGPLLYPTVSLAVAVILFEGGLSLTFKEFHAVGSVSLRLVSLGMVVSWLLGSLAAHWIFGISWSLSALLGSVLVVTGPTVIMPMLQQIRPAGSVGPILKWEGIVIDPIGAMLALLTFQIITTGDAPLPIIAATIGKTLLTGTSLGLAGAGLLILLLKKDWAPDYLQNPVSLMLVVAVFASANGLQHEAGLLAVTVMGFTLANQKFVSVHHIIEFKETLGVMLIAFIFILLAASLRPSDLAALGFSSLLFLLALLLLVRPASVFVATLGSKLTRQEKVFLSCLAPRGIVAAAVSSIFALRLHESGYPGSDVLVAITFFVIIGTVTIYGLTAAPLARRLGLAKAHPDGILFLGGRFWVRHIALFLKKEGYPVMIVDNSRQNILAARMAGIPATYASIFSEPVLDQVELGDLGKLLAMTGNDDTNSLAALQFSRLFGRDQVFQLALEEASADANAGRHLRGRTLFSDEANHAVLTQRFLDDWSLKKTKLSKEFSFDDFMAKYQGKALPLFLVTEQGRLQVFSTEAKLSPEPGQALICLVPAGKGDNTA